MNKILIFCICLFPALYFSQVIWEFGWPIDTPHIISGNYGELRPNHFHMGWDFSTRGQENLPVYAIDNGYVSRVKVSSVGYGKAVYISYPGNRLGVYAHLNAYAGDLAKAVESEQVSKQSYEVEFFPAKDELKVKRGDLIGYSGNTGSSTGPHLHFEIRDQETEIPLNLSEYYGIQDTIKPALQEVAFFSLADTNNPVMYKPLKLRNTNKDTLHLIKDSIVLYHSILGFVFAGNDRFTSKGSPNVIYQASLSIDNQQVFSYTMNYISFDHQRYVNEFCEVINKVKYQKCFLPTMYPQAIYGQHVNKGRILLADTNFHLLRLDLNDEHGNKRMLQFWFKTRKVENYAVPILKGDVFVNCSRDFKSSKKHLSLTIPAGTLYHSLPLSISNDLKTTGKLAVLPASVNLGSAARLGFLIPQKYRGHQQKLVLKNGSSVYNPVLSGDSAYYSVYAFGHFELALDTIGPKIKTAISPKKLKRIKKFNDFSFTMRDNLSGIARYKMYMNEQWVLAQFDAKSNLLTYIFDENTPVGDLELRVDAWDKTGNFSSVKFILKRGKS